MKEMFEKVKYSFFSILLPGFFIVMMLINIIVSSVGIDAIMKIPSDILNSGIIVQTETETETIEKEITEKNRTVPVDSLPNKNAKKVSTVTREISEDFSKSMFDWGVAGILFILFCFSYLLGNVIRAIAVDFFDINMQVSLFRSSYWNTILHKSRFPYPMMLFELQLHMDRTPQIKKVLNEISMGVREKYVPIITIRDKIAEAIKEKTRYEKETIDDHKKKKEKAASLKADIAKHKKELKRVLQTHKKKIKEANSILHNRFNYCKMYLCHKSFSLFGFIREYEERVRLFAGMCWAGLIGVVANIISLVLMAMTGFNELRIITILLLSVSILLFTIFICRIRTTRASEARRVYLGYALVKAEEKIEKK